MTRKLLVFGACLAAYGQVALADIGPVGNPYAPVSEDTKPAANAKPKKKAAAPTPVVVIPISGRRTNLESPLRRAINPRERGVGYEIVGYVPSGFHGNMQQTLSAAQQAMVHELGIDASIISTRTQAAEGNSAEIRVYKTGKSQ